MNYWVLAILLIIGGIDVYLAVTKQRTISQGYQYFFPTAIDWGIFAAGIVLMCWVKGKHPELDDRLVIVIMAFFGHVVASNRERYGER